MNDQKAELNADSLRRDSANVALAHAHTEIEFREQLKSSLMFFCRVMVRMKVKGGRRDLIGLEVLMGERVAVE